MRARSASSAPSAAVALAACLAAGALALSGCGLLPASGGSAGPDGENDGVGLPGQDTGGMSPVTLHLTTPAGEAGDGVEGRSFGTCGDLLVAVETVPVRTDDPAATALDFLLDDRQGEHGDPSLANALADAVPEDGDGEPALRLAGHEVSGDAEVFRLEGELSPTDACAAQRVQAQLTETARAHSSAAQVRLELNGRPLEEVLGLAPLTLGEPVAGGSAAPAPQTGEPAPVSTTPAASTAPSSTTEAEGAVTPAEAATSEATPTDPAASPSVEAPSAPATGTAAEPGAADETPAEEDAPGSTSSPEGAPSYSSSEAAPSDPTAEDGATGTASPSPGSAGTGRPSDTAEDADASDASAEADPAG